jgi:hypothetical protein
MAEPVDAYVDHALRKLAEREGSTEGVTDDGWFWHLLPDGSTEERPAGKPYPPAGYRWAVDALDPWATGGPAFATAAQRRGPRVPKLQRVDGSGPTHPPRRPPVHFDSSKGVPYR